MKILIGIVLLLYSINTNAEIVYIAWDDPIDYINGDPMDKKDIRAWHWTVNGAEPIIDYRCEDKGITCDAISYSSYALNASPGLVVVTVRVEDVSGDLSGPSNSLTFEISPEGLPNSPPNFPTNTNAIKR